MNALSIPHVDHQAEIQADCQAIYAYLKAHGPATPLSIQLECMISRSCWETRRRYLLQAGLIRVASRLCPHCGKNMGRGLRYEAVMA